MLELKAIIGIIILAIAIPVAIITWKAFSLVSKEARKNPSTITKVSFLGLSIELHNKK